MAGGNIVEQVRDGMEVRSSDGKRLGKVRQVHTRETEIYVEVMARAAFWKLWQPEPKNLFVPASAVAEVAGKRVTLNMDATSARTCTRRPPWIPREIRDLKWFSGAG